MTPASLVLAVGAWRVAARRQFSMPPDRLLAAALDDPRFGHVLVADPFRSGPVRTARRLLGQGEPPFPHRSAGRYHVAPTRWRRHDAITTRAVARAHLAYDRHLQGAVEDLGMAGPAVIVTNPFTAAHSPLAWAGPITYYAWDDWAAHPRHRRWWPAYEEAYERIRARGLRVAAVSDTLLERLAPSGPGRIVSNGVDPAEWRAPAPPPAWFAELPGPRIIYIGTLDGRLDVEALIDVARRFAGGTLVLLGRCVDPRHLAPLRRMANVRLVDQVGRAAVAAIVHAADVGVLPHHDTPFTRAMSPLKLYEYLAAGRPVAATDLPPVRAVDPRIVLVPTGTGFADGVAEALAWGPLAETDRRAFIAANSWASRIESLLALACGDAP